jgi:Cof subfamily protein (haloacid dehalogenase superfamily)
MVKDLVEGRVLLHRPLDLATTIEVVEFGREIGLSFQAYVNDEMVVERETDGVREYSSMYGVPYTVVGSFRSALREGSTKLLATCAEEEIARSLARLRERFGARLTLTDTEGRHVEACHPEVNKAAAVAFVMEQMGGRREEVVAVGDGPNDIEMLRWSGLGAAMGNAPERVKQAADITIRSNAEDGLAGFLTTLVKGDPDVGAAPLRQGRCMMRKMNRC